MLDGGETLIAYNEEEDTMAERAITRYRSSAGVWAEPVVHEGEPFRSLQVIGARDRFYLVYESRSGETGGFGGAGGSGGIELGDLELAVVSADGLFGDSVGIPAGIPSSARYFAQGDAVFALWEDEVGTDEAIFVTRYAQGEGWSDAERISADLHDNPFDVALRWTGMEMRCWSTTSKAISSSPTSTSSVRAGEASTTSRAATDRVST